MPYFDVTIEETLSRTIRVAAADADEAHRDIQEQYNDGDIVLDSDDLSDKGEITVDEVEDE